jgi:hypothetical protein
VRCGRTHMTTLDVVLGLLALGAACVLVIAIVFVG